MTAALREIVRSALAGEPVAPVVALQAAALAPRAWRRAERDRLLRAAARHLRGPEWRRAAELRHMAEALLRARPPVAPGLDGPRALLATALALAGGRVPSLRTIFRALTVTDTEGVVLSVGPVERSGNKEVGMDHQLFEAGDDARDKFIRGGSAAIFERAGIIDRIRAAKKCERLADQFAGVELDPSEFRGTSLADLARESLRRQGVNARGLHGDALVKRALEFRGGMNTTSDFAILLEDAARKTFLGAYATTPATWPRWCGRKALQDFRTATFYRPGSFGTLDKLTEGGEIKHKNIPDGAKATLAASTSANIVGITRKAMVNDDLGAFAVIAGLGEAAAFSVEDDVSALLLENSGLGPTQSDGQPLFHATNRANVGGAAEMSVDTWGEAAALMAVQKDVSGNRTLGLLPSVWLGPIGLKLKAATFNASATDPAAPVSGAANAVRGMVADVVGAPWLSGKRHYFLADPAVHPVFAVGFIGGVEKPAIESQAAFELDGLRIKVVFDYGVGVFDYRPGVTCPGQ